MQEVAPQILIQVLYGIGYDKNRKTMKNYLLIITVLILGQMQAQTGIGTTTPNASAKLDVYSTNKGFLPPRVTLTSATDATTIASPAEGLLVYNVGSVGLQAGYYYWNGANWATIATATSAGNGVTSSDLVKLYSKKYSTADGDIAHANGYSFTVPVSGRYLFDFSSTGFASNVPFSVYFQIRNASNGIVGADTVNTANNYQHVEFDGKVEVNLQANTNYNAYVSFPSGLRDANDYDRVYYKLVAGNLPVTGQTVEYGMARYTGADGGAMGGNTLVTFDATAVGNLPWSGNKFTLKANKTYEVESSLAIYQTGGGVGGRFQIYDYTNNVALANGLFMSQNGAGTNNPSANSPMKGIVTPTTDIQVGIRLLDWYGPAGPGIVGSASNVQTSPNASYFMVTQIGSSAIVNPWVLSGNDVYNNTGKVGIGTNAPTATLDVTGNVNVTGKINLTDPSGNVAVKAAGFVNAGTYVQMDNIKATITTSGNRGLSVAAVNGSFVCNISAYYTQGSAFVGTSAATQTMTTTPSLSWFGWNFYEGNTVYYIVNDITNNRMYRITVHIGSSYNNNAIVIERLL